MSPSIRKEIQKIESEMIAQRRDFHQHPEIGFDLKRTAGIVADKLESLGIKTVTSVGQSGVVGDLKGAMPGPVIALRADMDALPIQETNEVAYKSLVDGKMHACGHDGHMAILLGTAQVLAGMRSNIKGTVRFIFQPAEEGDAGASLMIEDGCLEDVEEIYGLHLWNYMPYGKVGTRPGPVLAAADIFDITVKGIGGHGAAPQGTVDAIVVASQLVQSLQTIVSRNTDPLESTVVTVGQISGGYNFNVIADNVKLRGTARSFTETNRKMIKQRMKETVEGLSRSSGAVIELDYQDGYPPTINEPEAFQKCEKAAKKIAGEGYGDPYITMGGEDFSYYLQKVPGCFLFVGSSPETDESKRVPHHASHFDIDERALVLGASIFLQLIDDILMTD
jgi:amidohydrolase